MELKGEPGVLDIRTLGLVAGIDLAPHPDGPGRRATAAMVRAFSDGLLIRTTGDTIALSPPLIVGEAQIDEIFDRLAQVLRQVA
jgi:beta-alanine--pyruvate transaminase